jgi:hypothetical protein
VDLQRTGIGPRFIGHLNEDGRVIGFVMEKLAGYRAAVKHYWLVRETLRKLHDCRIRHGDLSLNGNAVLIDFESAELDSVIHSFVHITLADRYYLCEPRYACLLFLPVPISLLALQAFVYPSTHLSCVVL